MKNYISLHMKYYKKSRIEGIQAHNTRKIKANYLLQEQQALFENYSSNDLKNNFNKYYKEMEQINKAKKTYTKKNGNHILESVVSLSNDTIQTLIKLKGKEETRKIIIKKMEELGQEIEKKIGAKFLAFDIHFDEGHIQEDGQIKYNVHAHLVHLNFNFKTEKSILRTLKKQDMSNLQDISANVFQSAGFRRGQSKEITQLKHLERDQFIAQEKKKQELLHKDNLLNLEKELQEKREQLRQDYKNLQEQEQQAHKAKMKEITQDINTLKAQIKIDTQTTITKSKKILGIDKEELTKNIQNILYKYALTTFKNQQIEELQKENQELKKENQELKQDIKELQKENQEQEEENILLKSNINTLQSKNNTYTIQIQAQEQKLNNKQYLQDKLNTIQKQEIKKENQEELINKEVINQNYSYSFIQR